MTPMTNSSNPSSPASRQDSTFTSDTQATIINTTSSADQFSSSTKKIMLALIQDTVRLSSQVQSSMQTMATVIRTDRQAAQAHLSTREITALNEMLKGYERELGQAVNDFNTTRLYPLYQQFTQQLGDGQTNHVTLDKQLAQYQQSYNEHYQHFLTALATLTTEQPDRSLTSAAPTSDTFTMLQQDLNTLQRRYQALLAIFSNMAEEVTKVLASTSAYRAGLEKLCNTTAAISAEALIFQSSPTITHHHTHHVNAPSHGVSPQLDTNHTAPHPPATPG